MNRLGTFSSPLSHSLARPAQIPSLFDIDLWQAQRQGAAAGFVDWKSAPNGDVALLIGESANHSSTSACVPSSLIVHYFRGTMERELSVDGRFVIDLNEMIRDFSGTKQSVSCFLAFYSKEENVLRYWNAGHKPALLIRRNPTELIHLHESGAALGLRPSGNWRQGAIRVRTGDRLWAAADRETAAWEPGLAPIVGKLPALLP